MIRKLIVFFTVLACIGMAHTIALADEEVKISATPVTNSIYMVAGKGGNIGLLVGEDGTFLIDDQFAPLTEKIVAVIKDVGGGHPKFLINTHYHGDHTGGNENMGKEGTLIFSHDNVRERLKQGYFIQEFEMKMAGLTKAGLPVVTFSEDIRFHLNGETVHAIHAPYAHTDGDSFIYFEESNVIHAGDLFFNGFYPFIDVGHGGTLKGVIRGVDKMLNMADEKTKFIAGHGPLSSKAELQEYRDMLAIAYERLNGLKVDGKSAEEAVAAKPLADLEEKWGKGIFTGERWITIIYPGV